MPLTDRPYQVKLFHALNIYRDVMRKFIIRQLQQSPTATMNAIRNSLWDNAAGQFDKNFSVDDDLETTIDVGWFKRIIERNWNPAFNSIFVDEKGRVLSDLDLISDIRNKVVHPNKYDINRPEALNALETIQAILQSVDAGAEADAVRKIYDDTPSAPNTLTPQYVHVSPGDVQRIAETVTQMVEPIVKMVQPTDDLTEEMKQTLGKQMTQELMPVMDSLKSVQGQLVEEIAGRIKPLFKAAKESVQQPVAPHATEEVTETLTELMQKFHALEARVTAAIPTPASTGSSSSPSTKAPPQLSLESAAPSSIADMWLGVIDELRIVKVGEFSLGPLLRNCRPIDVWIQRDPEKLILPFRNTFHHNAMRKVSKDPMGKELVDKAIANHFGRTLDFECVLENPLPF